MKKLPYDIEKQFTKIFQYISEYMNNPSLEYFEYTQRDLRIMLKSLRKIIVEYLENNCITQENKPKPPVAKEQEIASVIQREIHHFSFFFCESCGTVVTDGDKFCRMCGKRLKWE